MIFLAKSKIRLILFYVSIAVLTLTLAGLGFIMGYFQYGYSFVRCGGAPLAVNYHFAEYKVDYSRPGDETYPGPSMFIKYVCTEQEARYLNAQHMPSRESNE